MSSQKGNVSRSRGQRHQNTFGFKNDKYGATAQVKVREPSSSLLACMGAESDYRSTIFGFNVTLYIFIGLSCRFLFFSHCCRPER